MSRKQAGHPVGASVDRGFALHFEILVGLFLVRRLYAGSAAQPEALLVAQVRAGAGSPPLLKSWFGGDGAGFAGAKARVERTAQLYY